MTIRTRRTASEALKELSGKRLRLVAAMSAAVLACVTLSACQTKVGSAAVVMGQRITSEDVSRYVGTTGPTPTPAAGSAAPTALSIENRRLLVLNSLISEKLYTQALKVNGGPATADERAAALTQGLAGQAESDLTSKIVAAGIPGSFEPVYINSFELRLILATRLKITTQTELDGAVAKLNLPVSVSARYGTWSPSTHSVVGFVSPPYLLPLPSPTPAADASS